MFNKEILCLTAKVEQCITVVEHEYFTLQSTFRVAPLCDWIICCYGLGMLGKYGWHER